MWINPEYVIIGKFFSLSSENKQTNKLQAPFANNLEHFQSQGHQQQTLKKAIEQSGWVRAGHWTRLLISATQVLLSMTLD